MRRAFTLAEVLITLGIIGVVAAMVLPTLISEFQERNLDYTIKTHSSGLVSGLFDGFK